MVETLGAVRMTIYSISTKVALSVDSVVDEKC